MFHQQSIPYLAVVENNKVIGTITMDEIIEHVMHPEVKMKGGGYGGDYGTDKKKKLDLTVRSIMKEEPLIMPPDTTIKDVHTYMHKLELNGMLIGKENHLQGTVTHKELLSQLTPLQRSEPFEIQFHRNTKKVEGFDKEFAVNFLREEFLRNYEKFLQFGYLHVSLEQHKEVKEGIHRVICEMKLSTQRGIFYASHEGWGHIQAMKNSFLAIEHQINKAKRT